jgi:WD40 repeat protein/mono/diheme cytochrome c family protein
MHASNVHQTNMNIPVSATFSMSHARFDEKSMMFKQSIRFVLIMAITIVAVNVEIVGQDKVTYEDNVKEVFRTRCFSCHNGNRKEGDLDLTNYTNLIQGGGSGAVIEPGDADGSYLFSLVSHKESPEMPPESDRIPDAELNLIKNWIDTGALETKSSVAKMKPKKKMDLAIADPTAGKPAVVAMPATLMQEAVIDPVRDTATNAIATSPWAPLAAVAGHKQIVLYHTQTLEMLGVLPFPEGQVNVLKFSRNGSLLLAAGGRGGATGRAVLFDVRSGQRVADVGDNELDAVLAADVSPDQSMIALGGPERLLRVYSTDSGKLLHEIKKHTEWVTAIEFSPDGVLLASGDRNGGLLVWEAATGREYLVLNGHTAMITGLSWRLDSNVLASSSEDTNIRLWELENGGTIKNWGAHAGGVSDLEFALDGRIASCGRDNIAKIWDQNGQQLVAFPPFTDISVRVSLCDETNRVIAADWTGKVQIFNAADGQPVSEIDANPPRLSERLAASQQTLQQVAAQNEAQTKAATDALTAAQTAKNNLAAAEKTFTENQAKQTEMLALQTALNAEVPKLAEQMTGMNARKEILTAVLPSLQASKTGADQAAEKLADEETKKLAADIAKTLQDRTAEMTKLQTDLDNLTKEYTVKKTQLETIAKELPVVAKTMETSKQTMDQLTPTIPVLDQAAAESKQLADATANQLAAANSQVQKINAAITFAAQYQELQTKLTAADSDYETKFVAHQEQNLALATANKQLGEKLAAIESAKANLVKAQQVQTEKQQIVTAAEQAKTVHVNGINTMKTEMAELAKLIPLLDELLAKSEAVSATAPNDKELAEQFARSKAIADQRKQRSAELPALVKTAEEMLPTLDQAIATALQNLETEKKNVTAVEATVTLATTEHAAVAKSVAEIQQLVATTLAASDQASAQVDAIRAEIAALQGL